MACIKSSSDLIELGLSNLKVYKPMEEKLDGKI